MQKCESRDVRRHPEIRATDPRELPAAFWLLVPGALGLVGVAKYLGDERIDGAASLVTAGATMIGIALGVLLGLAAGERIAALSGAVGHKRA